MITGHHIYLDFQSLQPIEALIILWFYHFGESLIQEGKKNGKTKNPQKVQIIHNSKNEENKA